jgi:long-chain fatty acid transport protein
VLKGFKTLIDLHTQGVAPAGSVGLLYAPTSKLQFGLSYKTRTVIHTHGDLDGNAAAQLATLGAPFKPDFHYDAQVDNVLPQMVSGGFSLRVRPRVRLAAQTDWINWNKAFTTLPITLTNGNNSDINGFIGSNSIKDGIPLNWHNQAIVRVGMETSLTERMAWRAGYSFGNNPVPSATLLPLTAAIMKSTLATGIGYHRNRYGLDMTYQYQLPNTAHVGTSALQAGEYSNSQVRVAVQSLAVTSSINF